MDDYLNSFIFKISVFTVFCIFTFTSGKKVVEISSSKPFPDTLGTEVKRASWISLTLASLAFSLVFGNLL